MPFLAGDHQKRVLAPDLALAFPDPPGKALALAAAQPQVVEIVPPIGPVRYLGGGLVELPGAASLSDVVAALNLLGVGASDLVVILEALRQAGALQADMVIL